MTARSLAVRAFHAGNAAAAAAIARRVSAAPILGIEPSLLKLAGFFTSSAPPLSAPIQLPSMKHSSRSNFGSFSFMCLALDNGRDAHAAGGADRNQTALAFVFIENLCQGGDDACPGRRERMADRKAASLHVELRAIDRAQSTRESEFVAAEAQVRPGLQGAQHLSCEGFVYFIKIEVLQRQFGVAQHSRNRVRGGHEQA